MSYPKEHICDVPSPYKDYEGYVVDSKSKYREGDIWDCIVCNKSYQYRFLHELVEESPAAYRKTEELLKKKYGDEHPFLVWTTRKKEDN